jgi:hypothetical protein
MATLLARLISPERIAFGGEIRALVMSGVESDMTVLPAIPRRRPSSLSTWSSRPMLWARVPRFYAEQPSRDHWLRSPSFKRL